jgi:hypothetical protein
MLLDGGFARVESPESDERVCHATEPGGAQAVKETIKSCVNLSSHMRHPAGLQATSKNGSFRLLTGESFVRWFAQRLVVLEVFAFALLLDPKDACMLKPCMSDP